MRNSSPRRHPPPDTVTATDAGDPRWQAVVERRREADGTFVYAVRTTGVFCRPSCSSRKPRRTNVVFFPDAGAAQAAGFRPCKRCWPETTAEDRATRALIDACQLLADADAPVEVRAVARAVGLSTSYFQRLFKSRLGVTPRAYRRRVLAERARRQLVQSASVTGAVYDAGYSSSSRFYDGIGRELGMRPKAAVDGAIGEVISYGVRTSSLGHVLVGWTSLGVCQVALGDRADALVAELARSFPKATLKVGEPPAWVDAVLTCVEASSPAVDVPLDIRGTAFQQRVWQLLRQIPVGETRTYGELAAALGQPDASRAVARACAANPVAVLVPCHRVVRADGELAGYRWGVPRKRELLRREAAGSALCADEEPSSSDASSAAAEPSNRLVGGKSRG